MRFIMHVIKSIDMGLTVVQLEQAFALIIAYFRQKDIKKIAFPSHDYYPEVWHEDLDFDNPEFLKCPDAGWKKILSKVFIKT